MPSCVPRTALPSMARTTCFWGSLGFRVEPRELVMLVVTLDYSSSARLFGGMEERNPIVAQWLYSKVRFSALLE